MGEGPSSARGGLHVLAAPQPGPSTAGFRILENRQSQFLKRMPRPLGPSTPLSSKVASPRSTARLSLSLSLSQSRAKLKKAKAKNQKPVPVPEPGQSVSQSVSQFASPSVSQ